MCRAHLTTRVPVAKPVKKKTFEKLDDERWIVRHLFTLRHCTFWSWMVGILPVRKEDTSASVRLTYNIEIGKVTTLDRKSLDQNHGPGCCWTHALWHVQITSIESISPYQTVSCNTDSTVLNWFSYHVIEAPSSVWRLPIRHRDSRSVTNRLPNVFIYLLSSSKYKRK